jgi:hypothetical protein|nr:N-6 DNA methylase [Rhodococcus erythropolis]
MSKDTMNDTTSQALVAPSDIAEMARVSRGAVSNWRKRADDFPEARGGSAAKPLFARDEVLVWLSSRGYSVKEDHGEARVWSTMNALRGAISPQTMGDLILTLACARKLSDESPAEHSPWDRVRDDVIHGGLDALSRVARQEAQHDSRWSFLVEQPVGAVRADRYAVQEVVRAVSNIAPTGLALAAVSDYVLAKVARAQVRSGLDHGFVDSRVSEVLGNLATTNGGRVLYDPACGMGAALVAALDAGLHPDRIVGHEINEHARQQAEQRAYLRGVDIELIHGDVLAYDLDAQLRADIVIAEPPYGAQLPPSIHVSDPRWEFGMPTRRSSETTWIQHTVAHLAEQGRGFVVTPVGTLARSSEKLVRTELVRRGCVEAIIGLPGKMLPHVAVNLAVWVLRAPTGEGRPDVLFIDASDVADVEKRIGGWLPALDGVDIDVPHQRVDVRDVLAADGNLSPARWIQVAGRNPGEVVETYLSSWKNLNQSLDRISGTSASLHHFAGTRGARIVTVGDLIDQGLLEMRPGRVKSTDLSDELAHLYLTPTQIKNGQLPVVEDTATVPVNLRAELTEDGDVLVSTHGTVSAVVDDTGGGHLLGSGTYRLRSTDRGQLSPYYLALVLTGSWNNRFQTGTGIGRTDLRLLEIPLVSGDEQAHVRLADVAVALLTDEASALLAHAQSVREAMRDSLRYNVTIPDDE